MYEITELQLSHWADSRLCQSKLPILIRKLIIETTPKLISYRIPGNEGVALHGIDGEVDNETSTPWVPKGISVWEMGCTDNPKKKAEEDYSKRTHDIPKQKRNNLSFIFITPRRWNKKKEWVEQKNNDGEWLSVYAYDAVDLETWLENAPVTTLWLNELLGVNTTGLISPEMWLQTWSTSTTPNLPITLPIAGRENESRQLIDFLHDYDIRNINIIGDDKKEGIAFVISSMIYNKEYDFLDKTVVVVSTQARLIGRFNQLITIIDIDENNDPYFGDKNNFIIIRSYPRLRREIENSINLPIISPDKFKLELEAIGFSHEDARLKISEAGLSLPILRRQLANDPAVKFPIWANNKPYANVLLPCVLVGAWCDEDRFSDAIILELLGNFEKNILDKNIDLILALDDSPLAKYGHSIKVISPIDSLFALGPIITRNDLEQFFEVADIVLSEKDPSSDLPVNKILFADLLGKSHIYSSELITGICETLCILSIFGDKICGNRLNISLTKMIDNLIRSLLMNAAKERWFSLRKKLSLLAEAAPDTFLECLESDLINSESSIKALFIPTKDIFEECLRADLLWSLETLAWHREFFLRTVTILCKLCDFKISDNYSNTPIKTLKSIFCAWLPGTSVSISEKFDILRLLSKNFKENILEICISLLPSYIQEIAIPTRQPRWRRVRHKLQNPEFSDIRFSWINASKLIIELLPFVKDKIPLIIENFSRLQSEDAKFFCKYLIESIVNSSDIYKLDIMNYIRNHLQQMVYWDVKVEYFDMLKSLKSSIKYESVVYKYRWLFDYSYPPLPELLIKYKSDKRLFKLRAKYLLALRKRAIINLLSQLDIDKFVEFSLSVKNTHIIVHSLLNVTNDISYLCTALNTSLNNSTNINIDKFIKPLINDIVSNNHGYFIAWIKNNINNNLHLNIITKNLPSTIGGLRVLKALNNTFSSIYWNNISLFLLEGASTDEINDIISKLLYFKRPRTAYHSLICHDIQCVSADIWLWILKSIIQGGEENIALPDQYSLDKILLYLDSSINTSINEIIYIEMYFIEILAPIGIVSKRRNLKIHLEMAKNPKIFFDIINNCIEFGEKHSKSSKKITNIFYSILNSWNIVPGINANTVLDDNKFTSWIQEAMRLCSNDIHKDLFKHFLGKLLGVFASKLDNNNWLPKSILEFLDDINNEKVRISFYCAMLNARGVTTRAIYEGGEQENNLSIDFLVLSNKYKLFFPRVSKLLLDISQNYSSEAQYHSNTAIQLQRWGK